MDLDTLARTLLILAHLLAFALAAVGTAFCDYAILLKYRIDIVLMHKASKLVAWALCALWLSGLSVAWLDTGLELQRLLERPKLLAKLTVVSVLSINGLLLHRWVFPTVLSALAGAPASSRWPTVVGAISAASWLCALFIGISGPLAKELGYWGYMVIYGLAVVSAVATARVVIQPRLHARLHCKKNRVLSHRPLGDAAPSTFLPSSPQQEGLESAPLGSSALGYATPWLAVRPLPSSH